MPCNFLPFLTVHSNSFNELIMLFICPFCRINYFRFNQNFNQICSFYTRIGLYSSYKNTSMAHTFYFIFSAYIPCNFLPFPSVPSHCFNEFIMLCICPFCRKLFFITKQNLKQICSFYARIILNFSCKDLTMACTLIISFRANMLCNFLPFLTVLSNSLNELTMLFFCPADTIPTN